MSKLKIERNAGGVRIIDEEPASPAVEPETTIHPVSVFLFGRMKDAEMVEVRVELNTGQIRIGYVRPQTVPDILSGKGTGSKKLFIVQFKDRGRVRRRADDIKIIYRDPEKEAALRREEQARRDQINQEQSRLMTPGPDANRPCTW